MIENLRRDPGETMTEDLRRGPNVPRKGPGDRRTENPRRGKIKIRIVGMRDPKKITAVIT